MIAGYYWMYQTKVKRLVDRDLINSLQMRVDGLEEKLMTLSKQII